VPARVEFTIDLRHPDAELLTSLAARIHELTASIASERRCSGQVQDVSNVKPVHFRGEMVALIRAAAEAERAKYLEFPSGAGHDAMYLERICPAAMIFVPCRDGISHNEAESATASDLAAGTRVLARATLALADAA
jgi:N-carbamoyl-L-amino-acid hydrolase